MLSQKLLDWYDANKRILPWRTSKNPYHIWLSEIILQQTRVNQGLDYYLKFIQNFPTVNDLADASEDEVLKNWQGLGYYSRARNLHFSAKYISQELDSVFPNTYADILKLKGVGPYTAAAISSIAFNEPQPAIDGNVLRVISRILEMRDPIDQSKGRKQIELASEEFISRERPGDYNQALMDLGATICTPKSPKCELCPISDFCKLGFSENVSEVPVKYKKLKQETRYLNYLHVEFKGQTIVNQRTNDGIWKNLYDFPLIESKNQIEDIGDLFKKSDLNIEETVITSINKSKIYKHILSHRILFATFYKIDVTSKIAIDNTKEWIENKDFDQLAIPKLIDNYWDDINNE